MEVTSYKIDILVISVNIFRLLRPLQYRPDIKLIGNFQRGLIINYYSMTMLNQKK